jgi:trk system potassium uptake protein TrkA
MKCIIFGLGNFGSSLGLKLTEMGHEVIGVDKYMEKVNQHRDKLAHVVCMDCTSVHAVNTLPLKDADVVVVGIGEDEGASIMTTALLKQLKVQRMIGRAISPLHMTVLEAMGVTEIIHPEEETAIRLAQMLDMKGVVGSFKISDQFTIVEAKVPLRFVGFTIGQAQLRQKYQVNILTVIEMVEETSLIGTKHMVERVRGVITADTLLKKGDILLIFGKKDDIARLLNEDI